MKCFSALLCALALCAGMAGAVDTTGTAKAASIQASDYISVYGANLVPTSGGFIYIYFDISATSRQPLVGVKQIVMQVKNGSNWYPVRTYVGAVANNLLAENTNSHAGRIGYSGTPGKIYQAVVTFYAGGSSGGDSKLFTTPPVQAV